MPAPNTQFSIAIHLMVALGYARGSFSAREPNGQREPNGGQTSSQLAASINTSPSFVRRILSKLAKAGLVRTTTGKMGKCSLEKPSKKVTLLDIYRAVGSPKVFLLHDYPEQKHCNVSCNIKCSMNKVQVKIQKSLEKALKKITLSDVIADLKKK